ncbi:hypothetical protein M407DRAFT_9071 [Tulasnella calospora MUT 4182]|uniref:non-specific serine/threonine protein kinase n=1 Tax=Tulasnella calospora MUT 4182 TaxID=1051891 RepID=A0A0C3QEB3_9AGAM|nr:hypothetical protein M407DRAFT_9071 [Tulasnella calospora MUT 4182]
MASMYQQPPQPNVVYMAPQQPSQGTLMPGQSITLKHYTVTVERYLSQGGFAHVYLVRSAVPINGTTSHVLKRIAVSDDIMLKEVQKEVDVMKVLRGHPNIVNLIDSASFPHSNGTHEVFILMEYCAGGGIIDMMNRRLRERLTESEILTIFVEVLEGVACMHNLKPALLHRDLKVENILQASEKSYKLCDFGSAATAALKSPTTTAEIRAIEQDLLRHTTLQYRAPEMVDPYLRLPIDEKSDVWALGVLLYKLCYYTTPFEEHGPLAILNVHYKIPPYPVYSQNMINLIVSMLQKYGKDRPSVFDLLDNVHRLRGTRSQFSYNPPPPPISSLPPFSPAPPTSAQAFNTNAAAGFQSARINAGFGNSNASANPYNVYVPDPNAKSPTSASPAAGNAGSSSAAAARQHVLSAIQPMRRGRPSAIAPVISPTGGSTFAERDLLHSAAAGHDPDNQRRQQQFQEQQPNASSPDALVHVRPEPSRYGQQWQRGKPLESGQQQEPKPSGKQPGIVSTAQQFEFVDRDKAKYFGPPKGNADAPATSNVSSGRPAKTTSFQVDDDPAQLRVHSSAGGRPTSASPSANASANSGRQGTMEAWDLRGPVTGGGGDRKAGASQYGDLQQMSTGQSRKAGPPVPDKSSVPANRPTSDTSGDEEPEDATGSLGKQQGSRFRPSHTGRKQGSVYDLVDVGSGSRQPPPTSAKKSFDQFGRRQQSVHDLIDVTGSEAAVSAPIPFTARPRAESPQPLPSAKTPQSAEFRFPPIGQSSPPSTTRAEGVGVRRRPQSMFLSPSPSSLQVPRTPAEPSVPESPKTPGAQPESPRKIRHPRRNSIVDLVSKYEAMDAAAGARAAVAASTPKSPGGPPPPIASKPTTLQGHARNTSVIKRPSLDIPAPTQQGGRSPGPRTSPTVETSGRRMSISPSRRVPSPASLDFSQQQIRAPTPSRPQLSPVLAPGPTRPITPPTLSPSPERPYQGVASLISQWQKKSESSANSPRSSPKTWK